MLHRKRINEKSACREVVMEPHVINLSPDSSAVVAKGTLPPYVVTKTLVKALHI